MNVPRTILRTLLRAALRPFAPRLIPDERAPSYIRYTLLDLGEGRGRVYLHQWLRGDPDPRLHNHPWNALSIMLAGQYREERLDAATGKVVSRTYRRGDLNAIRPETFHRDRARRGQGVEPGHRGGAHGPLGLPRPDDGRVHPARGLAQAGGGVTQLHFPGEAGLAMLQVPLVTALRKASALREAREVLDAGPDGTHAQTTLDDFVLRRAEAA